MYEKCISTITRTLTDGSPNQMGVRNQMARPNWSRRDTCFLWLQNWLGSRALEGSRRRELLVHRALQDEGEIYKSEYGGDGYDFQRFVDVWRLIAKTLQVDPRAIRPRDRLTDFEVVPTWLPGATGYESDLDELESEIMARDHTGSADEIETIDDCVRRMMA